jgi:hypothetical protein
VSDLGLLSIGDSLRASYRVIPYITGLMGTLYPEGVISLQYADDTLLFMKHDYQSACHLKWLLICFEQLSSMKIKYNKSDLVVVNLGEEEIQMYAKIFCCKIDSFPFKYLGVPLHHEKLRREHIQPAVNKKVDVIWGSIPIYLMSIIKFPKWGFGNS